jgi:tRNA threonylcarbamoyl adenosine modification protein (Sua5/YciO/YrdC/YwlC family)
MERITLGEGSQEEHIEIALKGIRDGYVICAPLEHGYVYLADAFTEDAVRAMHVLRGDNLGVAAQVLIHSSDTITGISRDVPDDVRTLMKEFWPGMLSFNLRPNMGLRWNLGDNQSLDRFSVRAPQAPFVSALLKVSGPLAMASAARAGMPPILSTEDIWVLETALAAMFDGGTLESGPATTVIEADSNGMSILREGAITRDALGAHVPALLVDEPIE